MCFGCTTHIKFHSLFNPQYDLQVLLNLFWEVYTNRKLNTNFKTVPNACIHPISVQQTWFPDAMAYQFRIDDTDIWSRSQKQYMLNGDIRQPTQVQHSYT